MPTINIQIDNADEIERAFRRKPKQIASEMDKAIERSARDISDEAHQTVPKSTGILQDTIHPKRQAPAAWKVIVNAEYGIYVHEGTKPHFPPFSSGTSLHQWATNKGLPPFAVAKSISETGTEAQPFLEEAVENNRRQINRRFSSRLTKALRK